MKIQLTPQGSPRSGPLVFGANDAIQYPSETKIETTNYPAIYAEAAWQNPKKNGSLSVIFTRA